jgi:hypothetical protein
VPKEVQLIIDRTRGTCCTSSEHSDCNTSHHRSSGSTEQSSHASLDTQPSLAPQSPTHVPLDHNHDPSGRNRFAGVVNGSTPTALLANSIEQEEWLALLHARTEIHIGDEVRTAAWLDRVLAFASDERPSSPPDLPSIRPFDPRGSMSNECPSYSEETGVRALLTLRGASSSNLNGKLQNGEPRMQQQPNLYHQSPPWSFSIEPAGATFLSDQASSVIPEPVEAIASRSMQESARAASELEEVIAFIYACEKDQGTKKVSKSAL